MNSRTAHSIKSWRSSWTLPLFMTEENKYPIGFILFVVAIGLYLPANHFHFLQPKLLPMLWIDSAIPFLPNTVWIYISEYFFFIIVYLTCKDLMNLNKYFYSFLTLQSVSVIIFWIWPTTYPRNLYPLPTDLNPFTYTVFNSLRMTDTPANCCPSLHVSSVYLSIFIFLNDQKEKFPFFCIWGTAIAISTLTTKQHYLIDVFSGFLMALLTHWVFHKFVSYRSSAISAPRIDSVPQISDSTPSIGG